ncbi:MAG: hypothetical protein WEB00_07785 [Dehalococcoidia bacterium]
MRFFNDDKKQRIALVEGVRAELIRRGRTAEAYVPAVWVWFFSAVEQAGNLAGFLLAEQKNGYFRKHELSVKRVERFLSVAVADILVWYTSSEQASIGDLMSPRRWPLVGTPYEGTTFQQIICRSLDPIAESYYGIFSEVIQSDENATILYAHGTARNLAVAVASDNSPAFRSTLDSARAGFAFVIPIPEMDELSVIRADIYNDFILSFKQRLQLSFPG